MFRNLNWIAVWAMLSLVPKLAQGYEITLNQQQVNGLVKLNFPIYQQLDGLDFILSEPSVMLFAVNQHVQMRAKVAVTQGSQLLRSNATLVGTVSFNKNNNKLEILQPRLTDFKILENTFEHATESAAKVADIIARQIPENFQVDLNMLNQLFPGMGLQPKAVTILPQGLNLVL